MGNSKIILNKSIPKDVVKEKANETIDRNVKFSFKYLDIKHELFNLGNSISNPQVVEKEWFLDMLECLKRASQLSIQQFKQDKVFDLHEVNWKNTNARKPEIAEQVDFWQFRINKSKGRIIGILIDEIFYIVWLDRHHNLTNSEGYGKAVQYYTPKSLYEEREDKIKSLESELDSVRKELDEYKQLFDDYSKGVK